MANNLGLNTSGTTNTNSYKVGRGILYAALLPTSLSLTAGLAWRDLGNAPSLSITTTTEKIEHPSSRAGLKVIDKTIITQQKEEIKFSLEEINEQNMTLLLTGTASAPTNSAIAGFTKWTMIPATSLAVNTWYDIYNASGVRAFDVAANKIAMETTNGTPVVLTADTDYTLDRTMGRVFIKDTAVITTAIGGVEGIAVTLTADASASPLRQISGLSTTPGAYALKFIGENAATGDKEEIVWHQVTLYADGEFGLISDDVAKMNFTATAQQNSYTGKTMTRTTVTTPR